MAVAGWILDKSAAARAINPEISRQLLELSGRLFVCPVGRLEQLYSARSAQDYDNVEKYLDEGFDSVIAPPDILDRALRLQRDLAHHHGMWHRIPIPDLLIAETALHHNFGLVHLDGDFERIAEVRPLVLRKLST